MALRTMGPRQRDPRDSLAQDLHRWREMVRRLPAVRVEKVVATRAALRSSSYDNEHIFDQMVSRLGNDIGILCRRGLMAGDGCHRSGPPNGA